MAYINESTVLDAALTVIKSNATHIYICSAQPSNYTEASSTYALGNKNFGAGNVTPGAIAAGSPSGRKITTAAITDGSVTSTNTATHWAVTSGSVLYAANTVSASQVVTNGNTFTLAAFDIRLPGVGG